MVGPAADEAEAAASSQGDTDRPAVLMLPAGVEDERSPELGALGPPMDRRSPFRIAVLAALGAGCVYILARGVLDVASVLVIIGLALFVAVGLNPIIELLVARHVPRLVAVLLLVVVFIAAFAGFLISVAPVVANEVHHFSSQYPSYRRDLLHGNSLGARIVKDGHLQKYLSGTKAPKIPLSGGLLGAGKVVLSVVTGAVAVGVLTIYFLIAMPSVRELWLSLVPRSRRERTRLLTNEVFDRVGGFMLGNLITSFVSGVLTFVWLFAFGVPYPLLLAILVAILDLIPMVGSTIGGVIVSLVALSVSLPVAIGTAAFYIFYRFAEDYLLNPRVMKHTVKVSPGLTIVASLVGAELLGLIGVLVAVPAVATVALLVQEIVVPRQDQR